MIDLILTLLTAFLFPGIILRVKAMASGRKGQTVMQPWKDIWKLIRKGSVYSKTTSFVFQIAPSVQLACVLCAVFLLPFDNQEPLLSFKGDVVFFAYLLGLGRFMMIISALDTGSPFEGMGANREALYSMLAEPAFFILIGSFAMLSGYSSFKDIYSHLHFGNYASYLLCGLATYLLVQLAMIECSRLPVDDPNTHLELTMVHEVMILDNSGFDLAIIQIATHLRFAIYGSLFANFFLHPDWTIGLNATLFLAIQFAFAVFVGLLESFRARNKMQKNPQFILTLSSVAIVIFFTVLIITQKV